MKQSVRDLWNCKLIPTAQQQRWLTQSKTGHVALDVEWVGRETGTTTALLMATTLDAFNSDFRGIVFGNDSRHLKFLIGQFQRIMTNEVAWESSQNVATFRRGRGGKVRFCVADDIRMLKGASVNFLGFDAWPGFVFYNAAASCLRDRGRIFLIQGSSLDRIDPVVEEGVDNEVVVC